jgi:uncharacterized protein YjbJ (UPF0337 family)
MVGGAPGTAPTSDEKHDRQGEERAVGLDDVDDKAQHQAQDIKGRAKEAAGAATGDKDMKAEGRSDQGQAKAKEAVRHLKEAAKDTKDTIKPK